MNIKTSQRRSPGYTLVEVSLALVIAGALAAMVVTVYAMTPKAFAKMRDRNRATAIATAAMEEIKCRKWDEAYPAMTMSAIGTDPGEVAGNKSTFDDIDDFNGYTESPPLYMNRTPKSGLQGFAVSVDTVCYVDSALNYSAAGTRRKKISVSVSKNGVKLLTLNTVVSQK